MRGQGEMHDTATRPDGFDVAQALDIAQLLPAQYAAYRPLVMDGLRFFLERLSPARLAAIVADQLELPEDVSLADRLVALLRHRRGVNPIRHGAVLA